MRSMYLRTVPVVLASLLMSACTSLGTQQGAPPAVAYSVSPAAERAEAARVQALRALPAWAFQGRVAVSRGKDGGSGRLDWKQQVHRYQIQLSAPVTRQSWVLQGEGGGPARLDGLQGGPREGDDARQLLLDATGWDIPVEGLPDWTRGLVLERSSESAVQRDAQGRPRRLQQDGWDVQYLEWQPASDDLPALPRRIEATRGDAKVRMVIDQWDLAPQ